MSIKPLPEDVIRRISSSATITSLNAVVCGLIKNSFDAGATRINITVDYSRGNCTVEDDGLGILPIEFREAGGLGKLYHTSRHSPESEAHGASGNFLASLAALSLLSITSHHHLHNSQNSLTLHNAKVLARNVPALPEQRLLAFAHGTRVIVRDLFGSMAVRVKQRAVAAEKAAVDKEWSRLVHDLAALLLAWPSPVALYARDTIHNNEIRFKPTSTSIKTAKFNLLGHSSLILAQSGLSGGLDHVSWIPIGATRGKLTIDGCISLSPVATRRAQFISFGIHPVANEHGTNVLYTEVNRVFVNSGFAIEEDVDMSLDQDELLVSLKGLANRNVRPKRGLDRWPMFHFRISSSSGVRPLLTSSFEDLLEERNRTLSDMIGLLKLVCHEFLKKYHFRPHKFNDSLRRPGYEGKDEVTQSSGRPGKRSRPVSMASSRSNSATPTPRPDSPFDLWQRVKAGQVSAATSKSGRSTPISSTASPLATAVSSVNEEEEQDLQPSLRFLDDSGNVLRRPFEDVPFLASPKKAALPYQASSSESSPEEARQYTATETGLAESAQPQEVSQDSSQFPNVNTPFTSAFQRFKENSAQPAKEPSDWFKGVLSKWENPVFEPVQSAVPRVDDTSLGGGDEDVGSTQATDAGCCHHTSMSNIKLTGRISKAALLGAEVVSQVDAKFILIKLHREQVSGRARPELQRNSVLVLVDQHAADERCRLEALMQNYFEKADGSDEVVARTQALEKPLQFEFSNKEHLLLRRYAHHLRRWGIFYMLANDWWHKSRQLPKFEVLSLPPSIYERCMTDPKLLAEVLRNEIWKLEEEGRPTTRPFTAAKGIAGGDIDWVSNFHGCPQGILDLLHSRSCRSAIMFNDVLSKDECKDLVRRLAASLEREAPTSTDTQRRPQHNSHRRPSDEPLTPRDVAMAFQWKAFDFFDVNQVRLADDETRAFFESNEIASVCSGSDSLFLGSYDGFVRIVGSSWKIVKNFQAHDVGTITHMRQIEGTSLLVTVAEDLSSEPVLKIWALDKLVKKTNMPTCLSTLNITNNKKQFPISAIDLLDNLTQVAVGFANGAVTLIRGDLINDLGAKQRTVHESEEPVTGIELMTDVQGVTTLFISTTARILKLAISRRGHSSPPKTVEDLGCNVDCMTVDKKTGDVVVAREDAIYTYTLEGRGAPRAYESPKRLVSIYQDYVALICPPSSPTTDKPSDTMRRRFGGGAADALFNASTFVLLEPDLRVIGHTQSLISPFKAIFQIWGDLFVLTQDGKVNRFHERTLQQRLEMLYQRNMFPLAIELAQKSKMDATQQSGIFRRFGDHLYQKADYDGAMVQYIKAIDTTEPSQVIRKFLDTQRIHNLIQYLEQLHEHRKATADHTTLLLNCYAKLKDIDKLEAFIKSPGDLKFDLETAISMCRQGGYYEQAAYLAKKHGETDLVVDILIEDSKKYADALDFIWRQDPEVAYPCLKKYARVLIENCPKDATTLFIDYYTGKYRPRIHIIPIEDNEESVAAGGYVAGAANAVQNLSNFLPLPYMNTSSIASPSTPGNQTKPINGDASLIMNPEDIQAPKYSPPRPRTAFSSFIDHPDEFIVFLEACLKEPALEENDRTDLYTTLFEMYLHKSNEKKGDQHKEEWENKAKTLIEGQDIPMESSNVLLLSHLSDFKDGTTLVKEQSGLLFDIFRSYTSAKDTRGAIKALRKYGPEEPQLYPAALAYLTSDPRILEEAGPVELSNVLGKIDRDGLMAPLQVIQTLVGQTGSSAGGGVATMGMIKPYLHETIDRERKEIAANRRRITAFRSETEHKRAELAELGSKPAVFQSSRCSVCTAQLDLPAVHFLCKHSFHQRCLRVEGECPQCATDNATIRALRKTQIETAGKHELFKAELERGEDRFGTVAEWFGRGVMGAPNADTT
ncbi:Vacuolar protein sorting-associated protein 11-like protein [Colletotrichum aenigma]|uniref:Vacuolar protein sorting-associated protein 11-like protein n=1 Tax=Colletotrichum aenigma TaxID=1215731 RepID=UPI0018723C75|nr:Vacuolar protein sorting-associated protein 11-like protein [Colletotrichum aenigma]KAF5525230.1 Vacuolar protein sorting-associated protein 11-like protein [Colletotrichum aenigma]